PILLYVPAPTEIYAKYSTSESGANWLSMRQSFVTTSGSNEEASRKIAAEVGIAMISLRPAFEEAAREGKLVYYRLDVHWNDEGGKMPEKATAQALKSIKPMKKDRDIEKREAIAPRLPTLP